MKPVRYLVLLVLILAALILTGCDPVVTDIDVACSAGALIDAINTANSSSTTTTTLHLEPGCVYELTASVTTDSTIYPAGVGLPEITSPIIIDGQAATIRRSDAPGTPEFRMFLVASSGELTINNIFLTGGDIRGANGYGGAVLNHGTLAINTCDVYENHAHRGGAVYSDGTFNTLWTVYYYNTANFAGGALHNTGPAALDRSQFHHNTAYYGGGLHNHNAHMEVEGSIFSNNEAVTPEGVPGFGGAVSNTSTDDTPPVGKINFWGGTFTGNQAGHGGAVSSMNYSEIRIHDATLNDNHAQYGGAIFDEEELLIARTAIYDNSAEHYGGAIYHHDNIEGDSMDMSVSNSTLSGNSITNPSPQPDAGSAIYLGGGYMGIRHVTATLNTGAPAFVIGDFIHLRNSIVADNPDGDCSITGSGSIDVLGTANIDSDASCTGFTYTGDPGLEPLADNGGDTMTHALEMDSPAINAALYGSYSAGCPSTDQRNEARPYGSDCDLGAYESHEFLEPYIPDEDTPQIVITVPVPEEPHKEPNWWWEFEGYVCSEANLTEFFISTDADPELFSMTINERPVKCYQQSYDETRYWCHVELAALEWEIPTEISFCVGDVCETIQRTTLSQARCEGEDPPTEPEPQDCSSFQTLEDCKAAPGCTWQCGDRIQALDCRCVPEP